MTGFSYDWVCRFSQGSIDFDRALSISLFWGSVGLALLSASALYCLLRVAQGFSNAVLRTPRGARLGFLPEHYTADSNNQLIIKLRSFESAV